MCRCKEFLAVYTNRKCIDSATDRLNVDRLGQSRGGLRVEEANDRVELFPLLYVKVGVNRIDRDVYRATVRLKPQDITHHLGCGAADLLTEGMKVLEVGLVQRVADYLDVDLIQVFERETIAKVLWSRYMGASERNGTVQKWSTSEALFCRCHRSL